jgi:transcriptional regulator with XRE-family HTH domain
MHKEIGKRVQQVREYFGLTRKQFIEIIKVNLSTVSRIETGEHGPSEVFLDALLARFLVNPDWVKTGKGEMFISAKEYIDKGIELLGDQEISAGITSVLKDPQYERIQSFIKAEKGIDSKIDNELQVLLQQVFQVWEQGDERTRKALVNFIRAYLDGEEDK